MFEYPILKRPSTIYKMVHGVKHDLDHITEVEPQVPCVRLRGRINLNFSTTYAVDCGA